MRKRKSLAMQNLELRKGRSVEELIQEQFDRGLTLSEVARALDMNYWTLRAWLDRLGARLETRVRFPDEEPAQR